MTNKMVYFKFEIPGWLNTQVAQGKTEAEARYTAESLPDFRSAYGWRQVSKREYQEIIASW